MFIFSLGLLVLRLQALRLNRSFQQVIIKWRGKPVFIRHRTQDEIKEAQEYDWKTLRDPQPDEERVQKAEWLVMLGKI